TGVTPLAPQTSASAVPPSSQKLIVSLRCRRGRLTFRLRRRLRSRRCRCRIVTRRRCLLRRRAERRRLGKRPIEHRVLGARNRAVGEREGREEKHDRRTGRELGEEIPRTARSEQRRAAASAEHRSHLRAFAGLQQHDENQEHTSDQMNDGDDCDDHGRSYDRNSTIRAKDSTSKLAPPTSAPSTSGCAISESMLSGLTLPPY